MASLVQESGTQPIAQFAVPLKGTLRSSAVHLVPLDAVFDSMNVFLRQGKLRSRPGLFLLNTTIFDGPIIGGAMAVTPSVKILLAMSKSRLYTLQPTDPGWFTDTTTPLATSDTDTIDICFLETMSQYVAIIANRNYPLKQWSLGSGVSPITASTGLVPMAKSVCTAASRIIALVDPHTVVWSATLDHTNWPALAIAKIAQTNDSAIAVRSLGNLDFVIYKERSIYVAKAQPGADSSAFNIKFLQRIEGPAGIHAIVDVGGVHYFMTKNGRIGTFDGSTYVNWIADGVWLFLQNDIDPFYASSIFGVYDYRLHTVTFYYSRYGDDGKQYSMVIINLPLEGDDLQQTSQLGLPVQKRDAVFLGLSGKPCSFGFEMRFNEQIDRSVLFSSTIDDPQSFISSEDARDDDGQAYQCSIQTGCFPLPELKHGQLSFEPFFERQDQYGVVSVSAVTLDMLENETGTMLPESQLIDLNSNPVREYLGFNKPCRFFGLLYSWSSASIVRYAGTSIYGRTVS